MSNAPRVRVLHVEDIPDWEYDIRRIVREEADQLEIECETQFVSNYLIARSQLERCDSTLKLLISDVNLRAAQPDDMLGITLAEMAIRQGIPCITMSDPPNVDSDDVSDF